MVISDLIERALTMHLDHYDGMCGEAADDILSAAGKGDILNIECASKYRLLCPTYNGDTRWLYHSVAVVDDLVYDPWSQRPPCSVGEYIGYVFTKHELVLARNGEDFFIGPAEQQEEMNNAWKENNQTACGTS